MNECSGFVELSALFWNFLFFIFWDLLKLRKWEKKIACFTKNFPAIYGQMVVTKLKKGKFGAKPSKIVTKQLSQMELGKTLFQTGWIMGFFISHKVEDDSTLI